MSETVKRSDELDKRMIAAGSPDDIIASLIRGYNSNRRLIRWVAVSVLLDIVLTVGLAVIAIRVNSNSNQIRDAKLLSAATCQANNKASMTNLSLWNYLLSLPPSGPPPSAEQQKQLQDFKVFINKAFAQTKCK